MDQPPGGVIRAQNLNVVIYAPDGEESESCTAGTDNLILRHRDALPNGVVLMPKAKVQISGSPVMKGLLWSHAICAEEGGITLNTDGVISGFKKQWSPNFAFGHLNWRAYAGSNMMSLGAGNHEDYESHKA